MPENTLFCRYADVPKKSLLDFSHPLWSRWEQVVIDRDWQGRSLLSLKGHNWKNLTQVTSLWTDESLVFFFQCWFDLLNLNVDDPDRQPVRALWETDVVEVFLKPESCEDYFEIEVSPLGQCLDAHVIQPRIDVDFNWGSNVKLRAEVQKAERVWRILVAIPFQSMVDASKTKAPPRAGECWRLNLFRMAGREPEREFLAWRPTFTSKPDFHVPSAFGNILFLQE
jgi:hypothetical protein